MGWTACRLWNRRSAVGDGCCGAVATGCLLLTCPFTKRLRVASVIPAPVTLKFYIKSRRRSAAKRSQSIPTSTATEQRDGSDNVQTTLDRFACDRRGLCTCRGSASSDTELHDGKCEPTGGSGNQLSRGPHRTERFTPSPPTGASMATTGATFPGVRSAAGCRLPTSRSTTRDSHAS